MAKRPVRMALIGCGGMARSHLRHILPDRETTRVAVLCEPDRGQHEQTAALFRAAGLRVPPNEPDLAQLLRKHAGRLDAAFINTPHVWHHDQAAACLEAGLDVLLEKPMVMNAAEAESLIGTRELAGRLLVVAFPGSLSPQIRTAVDLLRGGTLGRMIQVSGTVWQSWKANTVGTWRQDPAVSGGGFLFDTGAHMLNTVSDLVGEAFAEVAAWLDNRGTPVDIIGSVMARTASGVLVNLTACGEAIPSCESELMVFTTGAILHTDIWGKWLKVRRHGRRRFSTVSVPPSTGVWEQFLAVREGRLPNPCPPEVGLRMARLWDAIQASAAQGGKPVTCGV